MIHGVNILWAKNAEGGRRSVTNGCDEMSIVIDGRCFVKQVGCTFALQQLRTL